MEFPSTERLKSGNSGSLTFGLLIFGPSLKWKIGQKCEGISVSVCYSLACHAGVKLSIFRAVYTYHTMFFYSMDRCGS